MRRSVSLVLGVTAGVALFAACREAAVAPAEQASREALTVPAISLNQVAEGYSTSFTVTIDPLRDNVYNDGVTTIRIPARAICDPASSSYGPAHWDAPCTPASSPITLPVTVSSARGRLTVHFGVDLRFAPTSDPAKQVVASINVPGLKNTTEPLRRFAIFWVPTGDQRLVDEGATDRSLITVVKRSEGRVVRRLKHFSGYNVHLGIVTDCQPYVDDGCVPEGTVHAE